MTEGGREYINDGDSNSLVTCAFLEIYMMRSVSSSHSHYIFWPSGLLDQFFFGFVECHCFFVNTEDD